MSPPGQPFPAGAAYSPFLALKMAVRHLALKAHPSCPSYHDRRQSLQKGFPYWMFTYVYLIYHIAYRLSGRLQATAFQASSRTLKHASLLRATKEGT